MQYSIFEFTEELEKTERPRIPLKHIAFIPFRPTAQKIPDGEKVDFDVSNYFIGDIML